ncbi:unnamed protein product [Brachionus calyciflorus]|uniref:Uncharacterized protein n=1 Tax=Brachionus calyciflorus TaxID=104777 RepID=A0A814EB12_9BILA|nr:unnamed protein product [Brachionus calyciflorus]
MDIFNREDFLRNDKNHPPVRSILKNKALFKPGKKRLFSKINSLIHTNGCDELIEDNVLIFIPKPYQLVSWRGVDKNKLSMGENVMIDISAEDTNLPAFCEFLIVKNGAAKQVIPQVLVRDAGIQINLDKNIKYTDFLSIQRLESNDRKSNTISRQIQTDPIPEIKKIELTPKPSHDKSVGTDDIINSLPDLTDFSIKDILSSFTLQNTNNTNNKSDVFIEKLGHRYRMREIPIQKIEDKMPVSNTKRISLIIPFRNYNTESDYEEYQVKDSKNDTEDLTKYFNFDTYSFSDLLSGHIRIIVDKNIQNEKSFKLIDIKIVDPKNATNEIGTLTDDLITKPTMVSSKITQTEPKRIETTPKIEFKTTGPKKITRMSSFKDLINSIDQNLEAINQIAFKNKVEINNNNIKDIHSVRKTSNQSQCSLNSHNEILEHHIEKYYKPSSKRYPLISQAINPKRNVSVNSENNSNSFNSSSVNSSTHEPVVDYLNSFKSCSICSQRRNSLINRKKLINSKPITPLSSFDNLIRNTASHLPNGYKNFANEYLVDNSVILEDDGNDESNDAFGRYQSKRYNFYDLKENKKATIQDDGDNLII